LDDDPDQPGQGHGSGQSPDVHTCVHALLLGDWDADAHYARDGASVRGHWPRSAAWSIRTVERADSAGSTAFARSLDRTIEANRARLRSVLAINMRAELVRFGLEAGGIQAAVASRWVESTA
jgi:hypothetical protein